MYTYHIEDTAVIILLHELVFALGHGVCDLLGVEFELEFPLVLCHVSKPLGLLFLLLQSAVTAIVDGLYMEFTG